MTEPVATPAEPVIPQQQVTPQPVPATENWEARYRGSVLKLEQLTLQNRELTAQLASKSSEYEQLKIQLGTKDVEKDVAVGERDKKLAELLASKTQVESELSKLRAMALKIEIAKELKHPELVGIMDSIPDLTDKEALKTVMSQFLDWGAGLVKARESQLLAGVTPPVSTATAPSTPSTHESWQEHVNSLPLGSPERGKAMDDWMKWGMTQQGV